MYPKAAIKALVPKISNHNVKIPNKIRYVFEKRIPLKKAMSRCMLSDPSLIGSKKTSDENRGTPKMKWAKQKDL
jgi:hypothetical protein